MKTLACIATSYWRAFTPAGAGGEIFHAGETNLTVVATLDDVLRHVR